MNSQSTISQANHSMPHQLDDVDKHCVFRCGDSWYSILALSIREILLAPELVKVPGCHESLSGLCHVRSEFIPVVQLNALLGERANQDDENQKMLVLGGSGGSWGISIAEVAALQSLETLINPDVRHNEARLSAVMGTATFRNQVIRVLDPKNLYRLSQELLHGSWESWMDPTRQSQQQQRSVN